MQFIVIFLILLFLRLAFLSFVSNRYMQSITSRLANLEMRLPQLESGVFKAEDSYTLAASLQSRLDHYKRGAPKKILQQLNRLNAKLESAKQSSFAKLDSSAQNRVQTQAEQFSYLPNLQLLIAAMQGNSIERQANTKRNLRWLGQILILLAMIAFVYLFTIFDPDAPEESTTAIIIAIFCVLPIIVLVGMVSFVRGSLGKSKLETRLNLQKSLETAGILEHIYGADTSRYTQIYDENTRSLDALLQRSQYQDLYVLYLD